MEIWLNFDDPEVDPLAPGETFVAMFTNFLGNSAYLGFSYESMYLASNLDAEEDIETELFSWGDVGTTVGLKLSIDAGGIVSAQYNLDGATPGWTSITGTTLLGAYDTYGGLGALAVMAPVGAGGVPEPSTIFLVCLGLFGLGWRMKKKK